MNNISNIGHEERINALKIGLVQTIFGITLPDSLDRFLHLANTSNEDRQDAVQEVFQMIVDRAADLPEVIPTFSSIIGKKGSEMQEQDAQRQVEVE